METYKQTVIRLEAGDRIVVETTHMRVELQVNAVSHEEEWGTQTYLRAEPLASHPEGLFVEEHGADVSFDTLMGIDVTCRSVGKQEE
jgi:hypothetical protein